LPKLHSKLQEKEIGLGLGFVVACFQKFQTDETQRSNASTLSIMVLMLDPQPVPDGFTWRGRMFHLTYKDHLPKEDIFAAVSRATSIPLLGYSVVHEETHEVSDDGTSDTAYYHTHLGMIFRAPISLKGSRKFDVWSGEEQYHPNVQPKLNMLAMEQIFTSYHRGRKFSIENGGYTFTPPVWIEQRLPLEFEWTEQIIDDVVNAPTLKAACIAGAVRPRTVNDCKALRDDAAAGDKKRFFHKFDRNSFKNLLPLQFTAIHMYGGSGLGKTKLAASTFENPCFIKPFNSVGCLEAIAKRFDPKMHDGLVLDEADLRFLTREQVIAFLDFDEDCELDVRFKSFTLPAGTKKILISNPLPSQLYPAPGYPGDPAIARRLSVIHITEPTWIGAPTASPQPPQPVLAHAAGTPRTQLTAATNPNQTPTAPLPTPLAVAMWPAPFENSSLP
jgi:hypothetical protein